MLELPIYSEQTSLLRMLSLNRLKKAFKYLLEDRTIRKGTNQFCDPIKMTGKTTIRALSKLLQMYPKKLDFCKLTSNEMVAMINRVFEQYQKRLNYPLPLVMIGHSKELNSCSALHKALIKLKEKMGEELVFSTYREMIKKCHYDYAGSIISSRN